MLSRLEIDKLHKRWRRRAQWREYERRRPKRTKAPRTAEQKASRLAFNRQHAEWVSFMNSLRVAGLTLDQYHAKYESQDFLCGVCGGDMDGTQHRHIDHSHRTGRFRGLLCLNCNHGLGKFGDDSVRLMNAVRYLERTDR